MENSFLVFISLEMICYASPSTHHLTVDKQWQPCALQICAQRRCKTQQRVIVSEKKKLNRGLSIFNTNPCALENV